MAPGSGKVPFFLRRNGKIELVLAPFAWTGRNSAPCLWFIVVESNASVLLAGTSGALMRIVPNIDQQKFPVIESVSEGQGWIWEQSKAGFTAPSSHRRGAGAA